MNARRGSRRRMKGEWQRTLKITFSETCLRLDLEGKYPRARNEFHVKWPSARLGGRRHLNQGQPLGNKRQVNPVLLVRDGNLEVELSKTVSKEEVKSALRTILSYIGEDPDREGLLETPDRILRSYDELYGGYRMDAGAVLKSFRDGAENMDEMVVQRNIPFFSMCEHHMLPFFGVAHIAYVPENTIVGLSKLARLVEVFARRLQVQERMTTQITDALMKNLKPKGAACVIQAAHLCMAQRGINKHHSDTITSSIQGCFRDAKTRSEFLNHISHDSVRPLV